MKKCVIDVTDLYHPYQDPGDNVDLIAPYAMEEIDLKAVLIDITQNFRNKESYDRTGQFHDTDGPRDVGIIPVNQLNYLFDEAVAYSIGPFDCMKSFDDSMTDAPAFQQQAINHLIALLEAAEKKIEIAIFSSARIVAVAFNREPQLFYDKVERIHLSAGASSKNFLEWNVNLDPNAVVCLLRSSLPVCIYPCATDEKDGPWGLGNYNTYWKLNHMEFIRDIDVRLKNYLYYVFSRSNRIDFLNAVDETVSEEYMEPLYKRGHNVWETAVWLEISQRKLVQKPNGSYEIITSPEEEDKILSYGLKNCMIDVNSDGSFSFTLTQQESNFRIFYRENPLEYQEAMNQAFGKWYASFSTSKKA